MPSIALPVILRLSEVTLITLLAAELVNAITVQLDVLIAANKKITRYKKLIFFIGDYLKCESTES